MAIGSGGRVQGALAASVLVADRLAQRLEQLS
jgi:hypothetical protein